jgi:hypothetical protein
MRKVISIATAIACGLLLSPAFAQKTRTDAEVDDRYLVDKLPKVRVDEGYLGVKNFKRFMASGTSTMLGFYTALYSDCSVSGIPTIRVVKQPKHGSVEMTETTSFSNYRGSFSKCNQQKVEGVLVTYKSAQKFIGNDAVDLLALMPGGFAWENHFDISVR